MDPFHIFTQPTGGLNCRNVPLPYIAPLPSVPSSDVEESEIPVKLELRFAIESRRFANGQNIPEIDLAPAKKEKLSEEQLERRRVRRERNKLAASKCRLKRREQASKLDQASRELRSANEDLENLIKQLRQEKQNLEIVLSKHACLKND